MLVAKTFEGGAILQEQFMRAGMSLHLSHCNTSSVIQYEIAFIGEQGNEVNTINYGVLERILVCHLGMESVWRDLAGQTQILVLITPWRTEGEDAAWTVTHYKHELAPIITDIRNIRCIVGRVQSRGKWGIIDGSLGFARGRFVDKDIYMDSDSDTDGSEDEEG
jgi:hypothetical protein